MLPRKTNLSDTFLLARAYAGRSAVVRIEVHGKTIVSVTASASSTVGLTSLHPCFAVTRLPRPQGRPTSRPAPATWSRPSTNDRLAFLYRSDLDPVTGVPFGVIQPAIC